MRHVWVNAKTFLETKVEGVPRRLDGKPHARGDLLRDFRSEGDVSSARHRDARGRAARSEKIIIDSVTVNPKLDDARFTKST